MGKKLFVGNLPWKVDGERLRGWVVEQGYDCEKAEVILEQDTGRSRGFGFLHFPTDAAAEEALRELDGVELDGRVVHVEEATPSGGGRGGGDRGRRSGRMSSPGGGGRREERDDSGATFASDRGRGRDRRRDW
jgi:RNA recognition motif-containing protein